MHHVIQAKHTDGGGGCGGGDDDSDGDFTEYTFEWLTKRILAANNLHFGFEIL